MNEALDFILKASEFGQGSEIFLPKIKAYTINNIKESLIEILGNFEENNIGIRPGEKLHETLISNEEIRYAWEYNDMYMITNPLYPLFHPDVINNNYNGIKKITNMDSYSSDKVDKINKMELIEIIKKSNILS
jgi:FlaA1/EpsC-like NDP-sugar epimerase